MSVTARLMAFGCLLFGVSSAAMAQVSGPEAAAAVAGGAAGYGDVRPVKVENFEPAQVTISSGTVLDAKTGAVVGNLPGQTPVHSTKANVGTVDGLTTLTTFYNSFAAQNGPSTGQEFRFTMIGGDPQVGKTTTFRAPIDEVSLQLLNADGSTFAVVPFAPFEDLVLESPNFNTTNYRSGANIQFADAVQRAQYFSRMAPNWHTVLQPTVVSRVTITVPRFVNLQLSNGTIIQARSYFTGTAGDGSTYVLMLQPLFNFFFFNEVVNQIDAGNFTPDAINMTLFPNTYLFSLNVNNPNAPGSCCVLGFHTYFLDGAIPQDRWVTQYASWISPGLFGAGFQDVTALSHETSEAINDPFLDNLTPNWQFPGVPPNAAVCQANLEEGDPIEVLPNATIPITLKTSGKVFVYHPQIIPLLQWFEMGTASNAIDGAFSFPDETTLPHSALPCPQ
jgi:hypothetical protein